MSGPLPTNRRCNSGGRLFALSVARRESGERIDSLCHLRAEATSSCNRHCPSAQAVVSVCTSRHPRPRSHSVVVVVVLVVVLVVVVVVLPLVVLLCSPAAMRRRAACNTAPPFEALSQSSWARHFQGRRTNRCRPWRGTCGRDPGCECSSAGGWGAARCDARAFACKHMLWRAPNKRVVLGNRQLGNPQPPRRRLEHPREGTEKGEVPWGDSGPADESGGRGPRAPGETWSQINCLRCESWAVSASASGVGTYEPARGRPVAAATGPP